MNTDPNEHRKSDWKALRSAAAKGDHAAQYALAVAYRTGTDLPLSLSRAIALYRRAAEGGNADAQNDLGSMYLNGLGTAPDAVEATKWYRRAAEQNHATAQFNLALRYLHGSGVAADDQEAVKWLGASASQGHLEALSQFGTLLRFGRGIQRDVAKAAEMHVIAALDGDAVALGNLADYREEIEATALKGNAVAALSLAKMYDKGLSVKADRVTAVAWLRWGRDECGNDADPDVVEEMRDMDEFYGMFVDADARRRIDALLMQWRQRRAVA